MAHAGSCGDAEHAQLVRVGSRVSRAQAELGADKVVGADARRKRHGVDVKVCQARVHGTAAVARVALVLCGAKDDVYQRIVDSLEQTSTFKSQKVALRKLGFQEDGDSELHVLRGKSGGYEKFYDGYVDEVAAGKAPMG